jgi:hypothetical protein
LRLRSHDDGFVAAPPAAVYAALRDARTYAAWWARAGVDGGGSVRVPLGRRTHPGRLEGHRDGIGLYLMVPSLDGSLEWYLEPFDEGTIVHALLDVDVPGAPRRAARRLLRFRSSIRDGLVGLKRSLEAT